MRKVILLVMMTLDGFFDGPSEGLEKIDWYHADEEWEDYSVELLSGADTLLFGRKTYDGFAAFWPSQEGEVARLLNTIDNVVFSTTLIDVSWQNTRLIRDGVAEAVTQLKAQPGKPILVFGSADFAATLMQHDLVDEYHIAVNPVVLGDGTALFKRQTGRRNLRLLDTRIFTSRIVELRYVPRAAGP
jgi:dihydrofolate reductase